MNLDSFFYWVGVLSIVLLLVFLLPFVAALPAIVLMTLEKVVEKLILAWEARVWDGDSVEEYREWRESGVWQYRVNAKLVWVQERLRIAWTGYADAAISAERKVREVAPAVR